MLNCRQVTRLVSQSMDARLRWHQRLAVRFHLIYCVWCRRYAAHIHLLRKGARGLAPEAEVSPPKLSEEAKGKIQKRLAEALKNRPPPPP
jgi:hypothetical protein